MSARSLDWMRGLAEDMYNFGSVRWTSAAAQRLWRAGVAGLSVEERVPQRVVPFPGDFPVTGTAEALAAGKVLLGRRLSVARGRQLDHFEREMAAALRVPHALACSSGTSALTLSLASLGIGPGDDDVSGDDDINGEQSSVMDCTQWEFTVWSSADSCGPTMPEWANGQTCTMPDGWEPFASGSSSNVVQLRRCLSMN